MKGAVNTLKPVGPCQFGIFKSITRMPLILNRLNPLILFLLLALPPLGSHAQSSDQIVALVNDRIILKSEIDAEVSNYLRQMRAINQPVQFSEELWYGVFESMIDNFVLLEQAKVDSIEVSADVVDRFMDQRIQQLIQQAGSEQALEQAFGQSIIEMRAEFRENFRDQLTVQRVRESRMQKVKITRPEVIEFFRSIPADSVPTIPEQVALSQIVRIPPPLEDAEQAAFAKAQAIRDSIVIHGKSFEEMARKYSTGPAAANGGLLPMMPLSDLVPEYSAAAAALEPGEVSEVVRTDFGYHIIRLNRMVGESIETNNLLITIDEEGLDEELAIEELSAIRDSILTGGKSFSDMARAHSDDELTSSMGGRIFNQETGERLLVLQSLDPALYRTVLLLDEVGEISEPRPFTTLDQRRAFRIVRLDRHVPEHVANLEQDFDRIQQFALQQKQMMDFAQWMTRLREEIYIEYKIDIPERFRMSQPVSHELETPDGAR